MIRARRHLKDHQIQSFNFTDEKTVPNPNLIFSVVQAKYMRHIKVEKYGKLCAHYNFLKSQFWSLDVKYLNKVQ